jgi:STE24 endopeptidase
VFSPQFIFFLSLSLIVLRWAGQFYLSHLNRAHVRRHAGKPPEAVRDIMDEATYAKSTEYTLAKSSFGQFEEIWGTLVLIAVLASGLLPWSYSMWTSRIGTGVWAGAGWLFAVSIALSIPDLPFGWWSQFRLEERFGFNKSSLGTWIMDRVKMLILGAAIGLPLLALILKLTSWMGPWWWLWAWALMMAFQLVMLVLAPIIILPLFNKFTPLPEGTLRERLLKLGERTGFSARTIQVVDGSRRSGHSNAYFTGFGRFRKIVLYDTLIAQLSEPELEAVLAHEIGHYKRGHIPKMLLWAALSSLAAFAFIGWIASRPEFLQAFGFAPEAGLPPVLLLFALLGGSVTFWLTPLGNRRSRKHEYEADAYARNAMNGPEHLIGALRKLYEKNLSNLTPHPLFSAFYYSHPTLVEREAAMNSPKG